MTKLVNEQFNRITLRINKDMLFSHLKKTKSLKYSFGIPLPGFK
jgi:hypothetical protein